MAAEQEMSIGFEQVIAALPQLDAGELADVMDRASSLLKKAIGGAQLKKKVGTTPHQLERNHEWTKYVLADATMNGWESFVMRTSKLNKETEEKEVTEVELRESVETEGGHVFADTGKSMSQGQAMCYGKLLRDRNDVVWQDFEAQYEAVAPKASAKVVKKTSQQVQEEKMAKDAAAAVEKQRKADEKAAEKAKKEAEKKKKEEEKAAKEAAKKPVSKMTIAPRPRQRSPAPAEVEAPVPVAVEAVAVVEEAVKDGMPELEVAVKKVKKVLKEVKEAKVERPAVDPFVPRVGGGLKKWIWNEMEYLRDEDNYVWVFDAATKSEGEFKGRYNYEKDVIEECDEPQFDDELDA